MKRFCIPVLLLLLVAGAFPLRLYPAQTSSGPAEELKSPDANRRARAARELGQSADPSAVPALAAALNDPSLKVRREVVLALSSIRVPEALDPLIAATRDQDLKVRELAIRGLVGYYTGETPSFGFVAFWKRAWRRAKTRFVEENVRIDPGVKVEPKVIAALVATMNNTPAIEPARKAADGLGILMARAAVPDLVKAAYSSDEDLAVEALNALAKIKDRSAGPQLVNLLDSSNDAVKREAAVTLGILKANAALAKLQSMFANNPHRQTREKALEGLAYLGDPLSVPLFITALWSHDKTYRALAAEGLGRAGDTKGLPDLERAVQVEKDSEARMAMQFAITALGKADYFSALVDELGSTLRGNTAQAYLIELSREKKFLPRLYPYMDNPDGTVRRRLCTVLMFTGDNSSVQPLERLSHDSNADVAREALRALRAVRLRAAAESGKAGAA
jgi:HEAT repeat protein